MVTDLLKFIVSNLLTLLGLTQQMEQQTAHAAQESTAYRIQIGVQNVSDTIHDINWGNPALHTQLTAIQASIAALQLAADPVVLPTTPPTGYGGTPGISVSDVWNEHVAGGSQAAGSLLFDAGWMAINASTARVRFPISNTKYFEIRGTWWQEAGPDGGTAYPTFPIANIAVDDTLSSFLERESGYTGWTANGDGTWMIPEGDGLTDFQIFSTITDAEFLVLRDGAAAAGDLGVPPVWPGADLVTLGTPVDLDDEVTISDALDGVLISILSVPDRLRAYSFDGELSYRSLGALTFFTDSGDNEPFQVLGFSNAVFCPKSMAHAAGCKLRLLSGVVGTAIPWTKTP